MYYQALKEQNPESFDGDHCTSKSLTAVLMSRMNQFDNTVDTQILEQTDLADENARLDEVNPEYTGETIEVNGVERTVYNSNGERIAKSEPALRNFWNWFGDSKVVDEDGRPLVVYHGTPSGGFDTFIKDSFFTDDKNNARGYAEIKYNTIAPKGQVFSVYLKMSNPFVFDAKGHFWNTLDYKDKTVDGEKIAKIAKKSGYDGVIIQNVKDPAQPWSFVKNTTDYIVFDSYNDKFNQTTSALRKIANGVEEATVKDLRSDLTQYGGTNDITFVWGNKKKGIVHIATDHSVDVLPKVIDTVIDGKITHFTKKNKTVHLMKNGIEAVLSLDEHGNTKTWLLTGWDTSISKDAEREFNATLGATQDGPTFSRSELGALLNTMSMTQPYKNVNSQIKSTQNRGTFSPDTGNIYHQRTQSNGYYDAELKVIVLGRNMNTMTLPHEMAHFWLDNTFSMFKKASKGELTIGQQWIDETNTLFSILGIDPQQETCASMTCTAQWAVTRPSPDPACTSSASRWGIVSPPPPKSMPDYPVIPVRESMQRTTNSMMGLLG